MANSVAVRPRQMPLAPQNMSEAFKLAEVMAQGDLVPTHLKGKVSNCLLIVEQAMRWQMSPFAVAACTSVVHGRLMYEGKLVAAAVEATGAIDGYFHYTYSGEGEDRKVTVSATRHGEAQQVSLDVALKDARTTNDIWKKQPDQQLAYAGVRVWARRFTPAAILGVYAREEFDPRNPASFDGAPVIEGRAEPDAREALNASIPLNPEPPKAGADWDRFKERLAQAQSAAGVEAVIETTPLVGVILAKGTERQREVVQAAIDAARARVQAPVVEGEI